MSVAVAFVHTHCRQLGGLVCSEQKSGSDRGSPLCCCALASGAFHLDIVEFWWGLQPLQDRKPVRLRESDCGKWGVPVLASLGSSSIFELGCAQMSSLAYRLAWSIFWRWWRFWGVCLTAQFAPFCFLSWWKAEEAAETWICVRCSPRKHLCPRPGAFCLSLPSLCCPALLCPHPVPSLPLLSPHFPLPSLSLPLFSTPLSLFLCPISLFSNLVFFYLLHLLLSVEFPWTFFCPVLQFSTLNPQAGVKGPPAGPLVQLLQTPSKWPGLLSLSTPGVYKPLEI